MKPKNTTKLNTSDLKDQILGKFLRYRSIIFVIFVGIIYAYVLIEINSLSNVEPNPADISSSETVTIPKLDQSTLSKIESLQDNSVKVKTLFNQARVSPFN
jgi:hypothetical protein